MHTISAARLRELAKPLAALSMSHLTPATRQKLLENELSVNAYPTDYGGFVFVGTPCYRRPAESDLASIFDTAEQAGVAWLFFDAEAPLLDGLPVFTAAQPTG